MCVYSNWTELLILPIISVQASDWTRERQAGAAMIELIEGFGYKAEKYLREFYR